MFDAAHGAIALGLIASLATLTWAVSLWRRDVSIVDAMWPVFIGSATAAYAWLERPTGAIALVSLLLLATWAIRLSIHIAIRQHGEPEDRRYRAIRANNQPHFAIKSLYIVFGFQAALAWTVALPFMAIVDGAQDVRGLSLAGLWIAAFGIVYETVADAQLARFRRRADSRDRVLDSGLWRYSRHPNYFGECVTWWGFGLTALAAGPLSSTAWVLVSPVLMTVLLLKVSGVSLLEKDIGERRPEYARYVRTTNAFLPGPRRD